MAEQLETEFTFEPAPDTAVPDLSDIAGVATVTKPRVHRLEATYFDTDDLRLIRAGVTVRRRTGGDDAGWHLKVPTADDAGRTEVHAPLGRSARQPPQRLRTATTAWTRNAPLVSVATIVTRRRVQRLRDERRALIAEVCEDTVQGSCHLDGFEDEATWTEWELELGPAATDDTIATLVTRLTEASGRPSTGSSKLRRTLGAALSPAPAVVAALEPNGSARDVVQARIAQQVQLLRIYDSEVRRDVGDGVHRSRVAMRRLRAALATFRPWLDREMTDRLRNDLRWASRALGPVRDAEVMRERFEATLADQSRDLVVGPVRRDLDTACRTARQEARTRALDALDSARYLRALARLDALAEGSWGWSDSAAPGWKRLRKRTEREWNRVSGRYDAAYAESEDGEASAAALHAVRKATKRLRYAAEAVEPVFGTPAAELATQAEEIQTVLGDHQDSVVARQLLRDLARLADQRGVSSFSYGRLHGLQDKAAADARHAFAASWQRLEQLDPGSVLRRA